jgi:peptidoglycan/LPS O-acetylase OafA/YrhL
VETKYFSFVDGLRGLAILMVLAVHSSQSQPPANATLLSLANSGARGVQLFFILSAFTLYSSSLQRFPTEIHPRRNFYIRRAFRILPVWWLALLLYFVVRPAPSMDTNGAPADALNLVLHATFLFGLSPAYINSFLPGGWSLFVEETFYLFLPFVFAWVGNARSAARATLLLLALAIAWHAAGRFTFGTEGPTQAEFVFLFPFNQWFIFGLGILLYFVTGTLGSRFLAGPVAYLADVAALAGLWMALAGSPPGPRHYTAAFALFALCLVVSQQDSLLRKAIDNPVMRLFGRCCYSIYLFHWMVMRFMEDARTHMMSGLDPRGSHPDLMFCIWFVVVACACLGVGAVSFRYFEKPFVSIGRLVVRALEPRIQASGRSG